MSLATPIHFTPFQFPSLTVFLFNRRDCRSLYALLSACRPIDVDVVSTRQTVNGPSLLRDNNTFISERAYFKFCRSLRWVIIHPIGCRNTFVWTIQETTCGQKSWTLRGLNPGPYTIRMLMQSIRATTALSAPSLACVVSHYGTSFEIRKRSAYLLRREEIIRSNLQKWETFDYDTLITDCEYKYLHIKTSIHSGGFQIKACSCGQRVGDFFYVKFFH
jgi:hypothetical protein